MLEGYEKEKNMIIDNNIMLIDEYVMTCVYKYYLNNIMRDLSLYGWYLFPQWIMSSFYNGF